MILIYVKWAFLHNEYFYFWYFMYVLFSVCISGSLLTVH